MCKFSSKSGGVPFQPLGDLTWNDPILIYMYINHWDLELLVNQTEKYNELRRFYAHL